MGIVKKTLNFIRLKKTKKSFNKNANVDKSTVFLRSASCINSGKKDCVIIKPHCTIGAAISCLFDGHVVIGENTYIGPGTNIQSKEKIVIGNNVIIANNVILTDNNNHPTAPEMRLKMSACEDFMHDELWSWKYAESSPIVVEDNVWIGRDVRILKGVKIGKGSIVAMGAIVTHDVPKYSIVAGNPAKVVKNLSHKENVE